MFDNVARSTSYTGPDTAETQRMADLMADAWIAFARTGNPNTPALPQWPTYDMQTRATMIFDLDPQVVQDPDGEERELLQRFAAAGARAVGPGDWGARPLDAALLLSLRWLLCPSA